MDSIAKKICSVCGCEKPATPVFFDRQAKGKHGLTAQCKVCKSEYMCKYREDNKERIRERGTQYYLQNREAVLKYSRAWAKKNREEINRKNRERRRGNINYNVRSRLNNQLKRALAGNTKTESIVLLLGCSMKEFVSHMESQFSEGMSWDNYGRYGWHIDHIKPCASFNLADPLQQKECFHYTNLQPLWCKDNMRKHCNHEGEYYRYETLRRENQTLKLRIGELEEEIGMRGMVGSRH